MQFLYRRWMKVILSPIFRVVKWLQFDQSNVTVFVFMSTTHSVVNILVSQEFYLSMDLDQDFNWKTVLIKLEVMHWLQVCWWCWSYSNLGLKERNFHDFKDFDDFEAVFHQIFAESRYLGFTKSGALTIIFAHALNALKHLDSRFLLAGSSV
jgi:hypothetical protein